MKLDVGEHAAEICEAHFGYGAALEKARADGAFLVGHGLWIFVAVVLQSGDGLLVEVAIHILLSLVEDGFLEAWVQGCLFSHGFVVGVGVSFFNKFF